MKADARYIVGMDIPLQGGDAIKANTIIYRTHGCLYMDGGLLPPAYQEDFEKLIESEEQRGWKYLRKEKI